MNLNEVFIEYIAVDMYVWLHNYLQNNHMSVCLGMHNSHHYNDLSIPAVTEYV